MKALWENHAPWLGAIVGVLLSLFAGDAICVSSGFLSALATVMVILCGLSGVSISILLVSQMKVFAVLKQAGFYGKLIGMVKFTVFSSLLAAVFALVGLLNEELAANHIYRHIQIAIAVGAIFSFTRMFLIITRAGVVEAKNEMKERWGGESAPD